MAFTVIRTDDLGGNIVTVAKLALALDLSSAHTVSVATPTAGPHAANKAYVDDQLSSNDTALRADLNTEIARAQAAESTLTSNLASEVTRATAAEGVLTAAVAAEQARAEAAEGVLTAAVSAEASARIAADTALGIRIDNLGTTAAADLAAEAAARIAADNTLTADLAAEVSARGVAVTAEAAVRAAADAALQAAIDAYVGTNDAALLAEINRATAAELVLTNDLAAEVTRAQSAETTLTTNLASEVTRALAAEAALGVRITNANTDLSTEQAARIAGDNASLAAVAAEQTRAVAAELVLTNAIAAVAADLEAEVDRALTAEAELQSSIEAGLQGLEVKDSVKGRLDFSMAPGFDVSTLSGIVKGDGSPMQDKAQQNIVDGGRYLIVAPVSAQGIYVASASGVWQKAVDANAPGELDAGSFTFVENESAGYVLNANGAWTQFSGTGTYTVGDGLSLNGTQFSINANVSEFMFTSGKLTLAGQGITGGKIAGNAIGFGHLDADMQRRIGKFDKEVYQTSSGGTDFVVADCPVEGLLEGEILVFVNGIKRRCKNFGGVGDFTVMRNQANQPIVRFDYDIPSEYEFSALFGTQNA